MGRADVVHLFGTAPAILLSGPIETRLAHEFRRPSPGNASFVQLLDEAGRAALASIYESYIQVALDHGLPIVVDTPTWRSHPDGLAYSVSLDPRTSEPSLAMRSARAEMATTPPARRMPRRPFVIICRRSRRWRTLAWTCSTPRPYLPQLLGGCSGTSDKHLRALAERITKPG